MSKQFLPTLTLAIVFAGISTPSRAMLPEEFMTCQGECYSALVASETDCGKAPNPPYRHGGRQPKDCIAEAEQHFEQCVAECVRKYIPEVK